MTFLYLFVFLMFSTATACLDSVLSTRYYDHVCPEALPTIKRVVEDAVAQERRMGASLLRLQFHDCFVNGAHTLGLADECRFLRPHIYNDTNIDPAFQPSPSVTICPRVEGDSNLTPLDSTSGSFDEKYFPNLVSKRGVLRSYQVLFNDSETDKIVSRYYEDQKKFFKDFAKSMIRMGDINPLTGNRG
ncbi:heme peroxidase [Artemisia annua]|uniref:peroxidase n=1 Tax=Artemisia annua TaxID=35608 RepID=A0A2U1M991_ARTAN|nr:heme peroxidase [Artemisia annua]